ncbi:MAG: hypothetical protein OXI61_11355 [Candidatus Poribacteria bacterium]|nr:hypothetical protein [Candidatus Poribacteria bacterium]
MKYTICFLIIFMLAGCIAPRVQVSDVPVSDDNIVPIIPELDENTASFTPPWDERIEIDSVDSNESVIAEETKKPGITEENKKSPMDVFNEDNIGYHFRKVRWGFSRDRVELSEVGNTVEKRTPQAIVYKCKVNGVNCHLIYTFENNKLRTAGYITIAPVPHADNIRKAVVDKYGPPDGQETYDDGLKEMVWTTPDTVIFSNLSPTVIKHTQSPYDRTNGGLLKGLIEKQRSETRAGNIVYYDGVHAHIDKAFFYKLQELRYPLDELSSYEKQLMGVNVRGRRAIIPGVGTIPQGAIQR